jgi:hypothetical protein
MRVRLVRKHSERVDGISLEGREPGDVVDSREQARLIIAEQRVVPERGEQAVEAGRQRADDYHRERRSRRGAAGT